MQCWISISSKPLSFWVGFVVGFSLSSLILSQWQISSLSPTNRIGNERGDLFVIDSTNENTTGHDDSPVIHAVNEDIKIVRKFLYVGVISSGKHLTTRAQALYDTWGSRISGKLQFFINDLKSMRNSDLPIVNLPGE